MLLQVAGGARGVATPHAVGALVPVRVRHRPHHDAERVYSAHLLHTDKLNLIQNSLIIFQELTSTLE